MAANLRVSRKYWTNFGGTCRATGGGGAPALRKPPSRNVTSRGLPRSEDRPRHTSMKMKWWAMPALRGWSGRLAGGRFARESEAGGFAGKRSGAGMVGNVRLQTILARERVRTLAGQPFWRVSGRERLAGDHFGKKMGQTAAWKRIHLQKSDGVAIKGMSYVKRPVQAQSARSQR